MSACASLTAVSVYVIEIRCNLTVVSADMTGMGHRMNSVSFYLTAVILSLISVSHRVTSVSRVNAVSLNLTAVRWNVISVIHYLISVRLPGSAVTLAMISVILTRLPVILSMNAFSLNRFDRSLSRRQRRKSGLDP